MTMSSEKWREMLLPTQLEIQTAVQRHEKDGRDFLDGIPKQIEEGLFYFGEMDDVAVYGVIHAGKFIVINAPGGDQLMDLLQRRFEILELDFRKPDAVLLTTLDKKETSGLIDIDASTPVMAPGESQSLLNDGQAMASIDMALLDELAGTPIRAIPIGDSKPFALAYEFVINDKKVLVTPTAPRNVGLDWVSRKTGISTHSFLQPQTNDLLNDFKSSETTRARYSAALDAVANSRPDIWLPSLPLTGQNANLYDKAWDRIIEANRDLAEKKN
jgi:hypothetical protein